MSVASETDSFIPEAEFDLDDAHAWYFAQGRELGDQFLRVFAVCVNRIRRHPEASQRVDRKMRGDVTYTVGSRGTRGLRVLAERLARLTEEGIGRKIPPEGIG